MTLSQVNNKCLINTSAKLLIFSNCYGQIRANYCNTNIYLTFINANVCANNQINYNLTFFFVIALSLLILSRAVTTYVYLVLPLRYGSL